MIQALASKPEPARDHESGVPTLGVSRLLMT